MAFIGTRVDSTHLRRDCENSDVVKTRLQLQTRKVPGAPLPGLVGSRAMHNLSKRRAEKQWPYERILAFGDRLTRCWQSLNASFKVLAPVHIVTPAHTQLRTAMNMLRDEGVISFWNGLLPAISRGFLYGGANLPQTWCPHIHVVPYLTLRLVALSQVSLSWRFRTVARKTFRVA
jgi:hypothetical protein